jgi:hypothetical protein
MKKILIITMLIVALTLPLLSMVTVQGGEPKYEYKVVRVNPGFKDVAKKYQEVLDKMAKDGWRLAWCDNSSKTWKVWIFEKEK